MTEREPDETFVLPIRDFPEAARGDLDRVRRLLQSATRARRAAKLALMCPQGHTLGWVFDSSVGLVGVFRSDDKAHSSGRHTVLVWIDFLSLTASGGWLTWGVACVCGHREVCRPWLLTQVSAGYRRAEVPKEHDGLGPFPISDEREQILGEPPSPEEIAAHERCASGIVPR